MRLVTTIYLLVLGCLPLSLQAQMTLPDNTNATVRQLSRMDCIALALEHNLDIRIARHEPRIAYYNLRGAYAYYEPTFNLSADQAFQKTEQTYNTQIGSFVPGNRGFNNNAAAAFTDIRTPYGSVFTLGQSFGHDNGLQAPQGSSIGQVPYDKYSGTSSIEYRQDLLKNFWIDANRLTIQLNKKGMRVSEYRLENQVLQTIATTEQAYFNLIAAVERVKVAEISLQLNEQLLAETKQRVKVGVAVPLDEKQVESDVATARAELIRQRLDLVNFENSLKRLLTDDYGRWYNVRPLPNEKLVAVPETYNLNDSWLLGISLRPDYHSAKLQVEMKGLEVKYDKNQAYPTLQFVAGYSRYGVNQAFADASFSDVLGDIKLEKGSSYSLGGRFSIPLGNGAARNRLKADKEQMEQLKDQLRLLHMDILIGIENAVNTAQAAYEAVGATREARVFAEAALDAERKKMENGKSTSYFVLDFQRNLTEKRYNEINALAAFNIALSVLYSREGSTLQRNKIEVEYK